MAEKQGFLHNAYRVETIDETRDFYSDWSKTYDQEITENGYVTPRRCAEALAQFAQDKAVDVLDVGCGTGLSGVALKEVGFLNIDGSDLSPEMLEKAAARKLYRKLWNVDPENPFPFDQGMYSCVAAMGVIATSHAPAETIDAILALLPRDGLFVFSLNDHTLQDSSFEARIAENIDAGLARLIFKEYGDHLPGIDLKSYVYVLQKA